MSGGYRIRFPRPDAAEGLSANQLTDAEILHHWARSLIVDEQRRRQPDALEDAAHEFLNACIHELAIAADERKLALPRDTRRPQP